MMQSRLLIAIMFGFLIVQAILLHWMGQPWICTCGVIKLWEGEVLSSGNSQHLSDWYSFSHVVHGIIFYCISTWVFPKIPALKRLLLCMGVEIAWELVENTPQVIEHYRQQALAVGYSGDSVLNSISDTLMMTLGFGLAYKLPWKITLLIALCMEIFCAYMIRDNLTLNVINLLVTIPEIQSWQMNQ